MLPLSSSLSLLLMTLTMHPTHIPVGCFVIIIFPCENSGLRGMRQGISNILDYQ